MDPGELTGLRLGPGPWLNVTGQSLESFWRALDHPDPPAEVPLLYLASLLPALSAGLSLPIPTPRATVNYGLNSLAGRGPVHIGDRVRALATVTGADWLGLRDKSALQIIRRAVIENQRSEEVLVAETVGRLLF